MRDLALLIPILAFLCGQAKSADESPSVIQTKTGSVLGKPLKVLDNAITAYLGIPFAEPPLGELRFKKPKPIQKWDGVLEATAQPPPCMQYSSRNFSWLPTTKPDENCLFLNVWTPTKSSEDKTKLPVLVWIYGGGYYSGSTDVKYYDGSHLASYGNVVVVSMNYRVGIFGFLSSGTEEAPGNMGLYDQNLALKWIHENIEYFGGDPNMITLFGESAGAVSVGLHIISPLSKGLFKRAIMQSGAPFHPELADLPQKSLFKANLFSQIIGCVNDTSNFFTNPLESVECLKKQEGLALAHVEDAITSKFPYFFLPAYGGDFLPKSPIEALEKGDFSQVDVLIGNNENEGNVFLNYFMPDIFTKENAPPLDMETTMKIIYGIFQNVTNPKPELVVEYYSQEAKSSESLVNVAGDSFGDYTLNCPSLYFAESMKNVYFYWLTHGAPKLPFGKWMGVTHFADIPFVFGDPLKEDQDYSEKDCRFSQSIIHKWISFAKSGNPLKDDDIEKWNKFDGNNPEVFELHPNRYQMMRFPRLEACKFWKKYFITPSQ